MTSSYLVLTAPGGTDTNREKTRFIRDGFTVLGFLFPGYGSPSTDCGSTPSQRFSCKASAVR